MVGTHSRCVFRCSSGTGVAWPFGRGSQANFCVGSRSLSDAAKATTSKKCSRAGGGASPPPVSAASRGPGSQSPPWLSPFPTTFKGVGPLHETIDLGPSVLFHYVARTIARRENLQGLGAAGPEERHRRARAPPARRRNCLRHASASRAFPARSSRTTLRGPRTSRSSASPSGSVSSALASKHGIVVVRSRSGHRRRMCKGRKGPVHPRHARGDAGGSAVPPTRTARGGS